MINTLRSKFNTKMENVHLREMLVCLAGGYPFVFGFTVYESFQAPSVARTGLVAMPGKGD